jgi:predicted PurR-regulated permease PerM
MADSEQRARRLILFAVAALIGGAALAWSLFIIRDALQLLYLSVVLSLGFAPMVRGLEARHWLGRKRKTPRWLAILILYVILAAVAVAVLEVIVPPLVAQSRDLGSHLPEYLAKLQSWMISHHLQSRVYTMAELLDRNPTSNSTMTGILGVVNRAVGIVFTSFTVLLLTFYLLVEGNAMFHGFLLWMPAESRPRWSRMAGDAGVKVGAWMSGQFVLCLLIGTTATIGFWIIGLPYFYVLGLICGLGEMVPLIGPVISAIPAVLVAMTLGLNTAVITTIFIFVQQQVENNIIIPRLMQKQTGISPMLVMVAILIGGSLLGVVGALLAVPTAAVIQIMVREYLTNRDTI